MVLHASTLVRVIFVNLTDTRRRSNVISSTCQKVECHEMISNPLHIVVLSDYERVLIRP